MLTSIDPSMFSSSSIVSYEELWRSRRVLSVEAVGVKVKILPNLVISNWLWLIKRVLLANQNWGNILNE